MITALQVLTEGINFGKLFFIGENGGTNVLDFTDIISLESLKDLVTREIKVEQITGAHVNVNVLQPDLLIDLAVAYKLKSAGIELTSEQEKLIADNSQLTIRVSGYAVRYASLTDEQRADIISRTFHNEF